MKRTKILVLTLVSAVVCLLLVILVRGSHPSNPVSPEAPGNGMTVTTTAESVVSGSDQVPDQTRQVVMGEESSAVLTRLAGGLVVRKRTGEIDRVKDGTLLTDIWLKGSLIEHARHVRVQGGRWETQVTSEWTLVPTEFISNFGSRATVEHVSLSCRDDLDRTITATWLSGTMLSVVAMETNEVISDVTVVLANLHSETAPLTSIPFRSTDYDRLIKGDAQLELPCLIKGAVAFISSPGRETKTISFVGCEGSKTVSLAKSVSIRVVVEPSVNNARYFLQAWKDSDNIPDPQLVTGIKDGETKDILGLPAIPLVFTLARVSEPRVTDVFDVQRVEKDPVTGGGIVRLCAQRPSASRTTGSIHLNIYGSQSGVKWVALTPIGAQLHLLPSRIDTTGMPVTGAVQQIALENVVPGEYGLETAPSMAPTKIIVSPGITSELNVDIDHQARLVVDIVDSDGDRPINDARLAARRVGSFGAIAWMPVEFDISRSAYSAMLTVGDYELATTRVGGGTILDTVSIAGAEVRHTVVLLRSEPVVVVIEAEDNQSGVIVPSTVWARVKMHPLAPTVGHLVGIKMTEPDGEGGVAQAEFLLSSGGQYRIVFPPFEGYAAVEPVDVTVELGKPYVLKLNLVSPRLGSSR